MKTFASNYLGLKVLTPAGYQSFAGVAIMGERPITRIEFTNRKHLECSPNHRVITTNGRVDIASLKPGDKVYTKGGRQTRVRSIIDTGRVEPVYDLVEVDGGHQYYTDTILSSNCEFVADSDTLINPLTFSRLKGIDPLYYISTARWYHEPEPNHAYVVALDPSLGMHADYGAIQVFQLPEMIQVAEWQSNVVAPRLQAAALREILISLDYTLRENPEQRSDPDIYWTFENNSIGEAIVQIIEDSGEDRFPGMLVTERKRKGIAAPRVRRGLNTTVKRKLSACARLKSLIESDRLQINSANLVSELKNFVAIGSTFKAKSGEHDDLVCATMLAIRALDIVFSWGVEAGDLREYISDDEISYVEPMPTLVG